MSFDNNIIYYGDVNIKSSDNNGDGDFSVENIATILGDVTSTTHENGSLVVVGGVGISGKANINSGLDVNGATTLNQTSIDTADGEFLVSGTNKARLDVSTIELESVSGPISIDSFAALTLQGTSISATTSGSATINSSQLDLTSSGTTNVNAETINTSSTSLNLSVSGVANDSITLIAPSGGIVLDSNNPLSLQSSDSVNIGTTSTVPITLGTSTSNVIISGNLLVSGTNTIINTETLIFQDNIAIYNSAPVGMADSGMAVKRFQTVDGNTDDVVSDTPNETSTDHGGTITNSTLTTYTLASGASSVSNYYAGWWIKITSGTNSGQVRRIQSYDDTTKVATIYATGDTDNSYPNSPLDISDPLDNIGASYTLHGNSFIASVYKENSDSWVFGSLPLEPGVQTQVDILKYINFIAGDITSTGSIFTDNITGNTSTAINISGVTVDSGALTGVTSINGSTPDIIDSVILQNNTDQVDIDSTGLIGNYILIITADYAGGAMAQFSAAKSVSSSNIDPNVTYTIRGTNNERILCSWSAENKIRLRFQNIPGAAGNYEFRVKILTS